MGGKRRLAVLDAGRTLAILGVIAVHLSPWFGNLPGWISVISGFGQYGVQGFFVISAVTICTTLDEDARRYSSRDTYTRFYVKRYFRIAPLYFVALTVYALIDDGARMMHAHMLQPHGVIDVIANLLFVHEWVPGAINSVVPGGWSIGVEMFFYLLAPLLFAASRTIRSLLAASVLVLFVCGCFWFAGPCMHASACLVENNAFYYFWPPVQFPCFIVGLWLWRLARRVIAGEQTVAPLAMLAIAGFGVVCGALLYVCGVGDGLNHGLAPLFAAGVAAAALLLMAGLPQRLLGSPVLIALGQNSYGVYIWSFVGIILVRAVFRQGLFKGEIAAYPVTSFLAALALVTLCAYLGARITARHIEAPISRMARERLLAPRGARVRSA
jgi:peptidoglycan/LPS O-acetylase OafA/YrhL